MEFFFSVLSVSSCSISGSLNPATVPAATLRRPHRCAKHCGQAERSDVGAGALGALWRGAPLLRDCVPRC